MPKLVLAAAARSKPSTKSYSPYNKNFVHVALTWYHHGRRITWVSLVLLLVVMVLLAVDNKVFRPLPRLAWLPPHPRRLVAMPLPAQAPAMVALPLARKQQAADMPAWRPLPPPSKHNRLINEVFRTLCALLGIL